MDIWSEAPASEDPIVTPSGRTESVMTYEDFARYSGGQNLDIFESYDTNNNRMLEAEEYRLLLQATQTAAKAAVLAAGDSPTAQSTCERVMKGSGSGLSNQDAAHNETRVACHKNLHMFWWPAELPSWTSSQWCTETWRNGVFPSPVGFETQADMQVANVRGKTALITGGDTGLGFATVKALAQSGAKVAYTSRNCDCRSNSYSVMWPQQCEETEALQDGLSARGLPPLKCFELDLLDGNSTASFVAAASSYFSDEGLELLVNNAGLVDDLTVPTHIFNVNLLGTFAVTKGLWPSLLRASALSKEVRVTTTSSVERLLISKSMMEDAFATWGATDYESGLVAAQEGIGKAIDDPLSLGIPIGYDLSKLADLQFSLMLQRLVDQSPSVNDIHVFSTHPGATHTLMTRNVAVGQMTRDQGCLPNLLALSLPLDQLNSEAPNFIGPVLDRTAFKYFTEKSLADDYFLKQGSLGFRVGLSLLAENNPLEPLSCLQMDGAPMQYPSVRGVEGDNELQKAMWLQAERGLRQVYGQPWQQLNAEWTGLTTP